MMVNLNLKIIFLNNIC